jgi:prepilin-type N-terminal cleavage/methylation domain-containing protein
MQKKKNEKGFTLVELTTVVAVITILAGIAIPNYIGYKEIGQRFCLSRCQKCLSCHPGPF